MVLKRVIDDPATAADEAHLFAPPHDRHAQVHHGHPPRQAGRKAASRATSRKEAYMAPHIRPATAADGEACGRIIYEAFREIAQAHGFEPDFPSVDAATALARSLIADPSVVGVVAERGSRVVGSNFLGTGDAIHGVGPITVDPRAQANGIGRELMLSVLEHANGAAGVRLLQDGFNMASAALYASLGFEVREPVLVMAGRPTSRPASATIVRRMTEQDLDACDAVCAAVHGFARASDLAAALQRFSPLVCERDSRIVGYVTAPTFWIASHAVALSEDDMQTLILGAAAIVAEPFSFLLPVRQAGLFRWCLGEGFRAAKPMTLMTRGDYRAPQGSWMPSVFY